MGSDTVTIQDGKATIQWGPKTTIFRGSLVAMFVWGVSYVTLLSDSHNDKRYVKHEDHKDGTHRLEKSLEEGRAELRKLTDDFNHFARNKQATISVEQLKFNP